MPSFCASTIALIVCLAFGQALPPSTPPQPSSAPTLVIVESGADVYHYAGCPYLHGRTENLLAVSLGQAVARGLKPHEGCDPSRVSRGETQKTPPKDRKPGAKLSPMHTNPLVYILRDDRRYHRASCAKMGLGARATRLDVLAPRYVPCPVCKPPARLRTER